MDGTADSAGPAGRIVLSRGAPDRPRVQAARWARATEGAYSKGLDRRFLCSGNINENRRKECHRHSGGYQHEFVAIGVHSWANIRSALPSAILARIFHSLRHRDNHLPADGS